MNTVHQLQFLNPMKQKQTEKNLIEAMAKRAAMAATGQEINFDPKSEQRISAALEELSETERMQIEMVLARAANSPFGSIANPF